MGPGGTVRAVKNHNPTSSVIQRLEDFSDFSDFSLNHAPRLAFLACWAGARTPSTRPSGSVCVNSLCNALGIDLPRRRLVGARSPVAQGPDGIRPSATARNSAPSGQLVGS